MVIHPTSLQNSSNMRKPTTSVCFAYQPTPHIDYRVGTSHEPWMVTNFYPLKLWTFLGSRTSRLSMVMSLQKGPRKVLVSSATPISWLQLRNHSNWHSHQRGSKSPSHWLACIPTTRMQSHQLSWPPARQPPRIPHSTSMSQAQ